MKQTHRFVAIVIAVLIVASALVLGRIHTKRAGTRARSSEDTAAQVSPMNKPLIQTARVIERVFTNQVPWLGVVESQHSIRLTTTMPGQVESIEAEDEAPVQKGELLFQLGGAQVEAELTRRQNNVDALKAQQVLAHETEARLEKDVEDTLATKDQLAAARRTMIAIQSQLQTASKALASLQKQARIVAPIDGIFTGRRVGAGQQVQADETLAEIVDTTHLRILASLYPAPGVQLLGTTATVQYGNSETLSGTVSRVIPEVSATGATTVWIEGPDIDRALRPGLTLDGNLVLAAGAATIAVPQTAVVYDDEENALVFVSANGSYERRDVRTGRESNGWMQVLSGLKADEVVVTQGAHELLYRRFSEQFKVRD